MSSRSTIRFKHRVEYLLMRCTAFIVGILPLRFALSVGAALGWLAWRLFAIRKKTVLINLRQAFPEKDAVELNRIALLSYMNSGRFMMEFARQHRMNEEYIRRHVTVENPEELESLSKEKGALIITGHFGNWELMGVSMSYLLGDVAFLIGRQSNGLVDAFINRMRSSHGIELYNRKAAVRGVLSSIRREGYVCWLSDQDAGEGGVTADFFGFPASTPRGAAAFSVKLNVPVVTVVLARMGESADHSLKISGSIYPPENLTNEEAEKVITQQYTEELEQYIRENPELYWWAHRRWKTHGLYKGKK